MHKHTPACLLHHACLLYHACLQLATMPACLPAPSCLADVPLTPQCRCLSISPMLQVFINHTYAGEFGDVCVEENGVNKHMLQPQIVEQLTTLGVRSA